MRGSPVEPAAILSSSPSLPPAIFHSPSPSSTYSLIKNPLSPSCVLLAASTRHRPKTFFSLPLCRRPRRLLPCLRRPQPSPLTNISILDHSPAFTILRHPSRHSRLHRHSSLSSFLFCSIPRLHVSAPRASRHRAMPTISSRSARSFFLSLSLTRSPANGLASSSSSSFRRRGNGPGAGGMFPTSGNNPRSSELYRTAPPSPPPSWTINSFELWHGGKPNLSHIRTFGSVAYTHVPKQRRNKLDSTAQKGILVGYSPGNKGYRVLDINTGIVNVRHVIHFEENERIRDSSKIPNIHCEAELENQPLFNLPSLNDIPEPVRESQMIIPIENPPELNNKQEQNEANFNEQQSNLEELDTSNRAEQPVIRQSNRSNKGIPPKRLSYLMNSVQAQEPKSWNDIKNLPPAEGAKWYKATNEEIDSLNHNKTWILTELPSGKNLIDCKWVFKIKRDSYGKVERYKARLVAKGFSQKYGEDFDEVFAPVVKHTTIRTLLTIAASRKMLVKHVDVKTAFLHGNITEDIYMKQPPGFVDPKHKHLVCKLQKGLYGLRQGAKCWNEALDKILKEMNFNQGKEDQCLYMRCKNGQFSYILTFVDDLLICCSTENEYKEIAAHLTKRVEIKELGDVSSYLGMQIKREKDGSFLLSQSQKILELLEIFGLTDSHPTQTPMMTDFLKREDQTEYLANNTQYREAIGKLLYICTSCRPDISNAVSILSRKVNAPTESDWGAVKRIVRYLKGTIDYKLRLAACDNPKLTCYTDSDWGGDPSNYRSTSGYCFMYGNAPIAWASIKQNLVSLSSTESEFYAASEAGRELCWLDRLLSDFGRAESRPIVMYEDNQSCIRLVQNEKIACRTKHIGVRVYRLKELSDEGTIELVYCPTDQMTADMLTKPLPRESFEKLRGKIGLIA